VTGEIEAPRHASHRLPPVTLLRCELIPPQYGELGLDRLSTEGAAERNKSVAPDIAAPLIAAVVKTTGIVKMATIEPMIANKHAFNLALQELHIMTLNPVAA